MERKSEVRRELLALMAAFGAGAAPAIAQDAVKVAPRNYKVVFENDKVRVLEFHSRPGLGLCGQGKHYHPAHLSIALTDVKAKVFLEDGKVIFPEQKAGEMFWAPAETHTVENAGKGNVRGYIVELKDANWKPSTGSA
jgi:hypothetical protein